ncbi:MAG: hypothetical protein FWD60_05105 [Candidatus Azobacteroides sp.]|nr:hypothetical protein [Candidatus Azobacteroides sp.]
MKYKLLFILNIFFLIPTITLFAQDKRTDIQKRQDLENLKAQRIAYLTKEIGLTEEEAKEFWPLSNELDDKKFEVNRNMRQEVKKIRDAEKAGKKVSDAEYDQVINVILDSKEKEVALEREYIKKIQKILPLEKVLRFQRADYKFAREAFPPTAPSGKK